MPTFNGVEIAGDAIKVHGDPEYVFESATLDNDTGTNLSNVEIAGQPVVYNHSTGVATFVEASTDEANTNAIIAEKGKLTLNNGSQTSRKYVVLVRGPAVLLQEGLPANDVEGAALVTATIVTQLEALSPPIIVRSEGSILREEQTT